MHDHTTVSANDHYEMLLNQMAALSSTLEAAGRQMQNLAMQVRAARPENTSVLQSGHVPERPEDALAIPCKEPQTNAGHNELLARIGKLEDSINQKDGQIADLEIEKNEKTAKLQKKTEETAELQKTIDKLQTQLADEKRKNKKLQEDCAELETRYQDQWREAQRVITELENSQTDLANTQCELGNARTELEDKNNELAGARDSLDKYVADFNRIQGFKFKPLADSLDHIPDDIRPMVQSYYEIGSLPEFLTQCGHFARLAQLWQSCRSNIVNGENLAGIERFLSEILKIYNNAFPENQGEETIPEAGAPYDYTTQERMGNNGTRIARVILPGLIQPNGQVAVKALVTLV